MIKLNRYTLILSAINIFLSIILGIFLLSRHVQQKKIFLHDSLMGAAVPDETAKIIFVFPAGEGLAAEIQFERENGIFVLNSGGRKYTVKKELIERLFSILTSKQKICLITSKEGNYGYYGLSSGNACLLKLFSDKGASILDLHIGKLNAAGTERYVRLSPSSQIIRLPDSFNPFLTTASNFWLDLQIYKDLLHGKQLEGLELNGKVILPVKHNEAAFKEFGKTLSRLSCIDIYNGSLPDINGKESITLFLSTEQKLKIELTPLPSGDFILSNSTNSNSYIISRYSKERLFKALNDIVNS